MISGAAFAKINLGLRVGSRREDGFHPVDGIFQSIELSDSLTLDSGEADSIQTTTGRSVAEDFDNLAFRAASAVREHAGSAHPIVMTLDKNIPTAAGLGGGSADAAAALGMAGVYFGADRAAQIRAAQHHRIQPSDVIGRGDLFNSAAARAGFNINQVFDFLLGGKCPPAQLQVFFQREFRFDHGA